MEGPRAPLHVLHIIDASFVGGGPRVLTAAARGLEAHGWLSSAICGNDGPLAEDLKRMGIDATALPIAGKYRFAAGFPGLVWRIRRLRPAAVIVYGPIAGCMGGVAARLAGVRSIVYSAGYPAYYADRGIRRRVRGAVVERISCTCADAIWCKSAADVDLYRARKPAPAHKFYLVPNCVSRDILQRLAELVPSGQELAVGMPLPRALADLRQQVGLSPAEVVIGFVGRLVPQKGVDVLLRAFQQLRQILPETRLVIAGDGPERARLERLAGNLDIAENVLFVGEQRDVVSYYLLADVVAIPSRDEPFGIVAVEAMAAARPVVASQVGGLADTVVDGVTGRLVPAENPEELAQALLWVLQSPQRAGELGGAGRQRALAEYSEECLAMRLDPLLHLGLNGR